MVHLCTQVLAARTAAVGLASASLAAMGKDTLDQLEDTRTELVRVQVAANTGNKSQELWAGEQAEWRRERETSRIEAEARQLGWRRRRPVNPRF